MKIMSPNETIFALKLTGREPSAATPASLLDHDLVAFHLRFRAFGEDLRSIDRCHNRSIQGSLIIPNSEHELQYKT